MSVEMIGRTKALPTNRDTKMRQSKASNKHITGRNITGPDNFRVKAEREV